MSTRLPLRCRACGVEIRFETLESGRKRPYEVATGRNHFEVCSAAAAFRKGWRPAALPAVNKPREGAQLSMDMEALDD
jgi:hypothetical protein